jgi:hypothetical protein
MSDFPCQPQAIFNYPITGIRIPQASKNRMENIQF